MKTKAIISLSGGLDSTTLLSVLLSQNKEVKAIFFNYGSKHNPFELIQAHRIAEYYNIKLTEIDLRAAMQSFQSNLMEKGGDIPEGHYASESMKLTVVPARNIIFTSFLAGMAWSTEAQEVYLGIHAGDHAIYPDCRPSFYWAMKEAVDAGTDGKVSLHAPFLHLTKAEIVAQGLALNVPYAITRTCYKNQVLACGKCGSCVERLEAFALNNCKDPAEYEESR